METKSIVEKIADSISVSLLKFAKNQDPIQERVNYILKIADGLGLNYSENWFYVDKYQNVCVNSERCALVQLMHINLNSELITENVYITYAHEFNGIEITHSLKYYSVN